MMHKTEHVSFSRSQKLYYQPKERGLLHKHKQIIFNNNNNRTLATSSSSLSLKQDRKKLKKTNTPYKIYGPEGYVHNPPCSLLLFCCVGEASFYMQKWDENGVGAKWVFKKRRWQKNWD
jgi:hypothetical protein